MLVTKGVFVGENNRELSNELRSAARTPPHMSAPHALEWRQLLEAAADEIDRLRALTQQPSTQ